MKYTPELPSGQVLFKIFVHNLNRLYFAKRYLDQKMLKLIEMASFKALQLGMNEFWEDVNVITEIATTISPATATA